MSSQNLMIVYVSISQLTEAIVPRESFTLPETGVFESKRPIDQGAMTTSAIRINAIGTLLS